MPKKRRTISKKLPIYPKKVNVGNVSVNQILEREDVVNLHRALFRYLDEGTEAPLTLCTFIKRKKPNMTVTVLE